MREQTTYGAIEAGDKFTPMGSMDVWEAITSAKRVGISACVQFRAVRIGGEGNEVNVLNERYRPVYRELRAHTWGEVQAYNLSGRQFCTVCGAQRGQYEGGCK